MSDETNSSKGRAREYLTSILIAVGLAILIRTGVVQAFYIPSGSMEDTLLVGDYLLANKFVYGAPIDIIGTDIHLFRMPALRDPEPGDIVIFRSPVDPDRDLIKRCVAAGGQEVKITDKVLYVDGVRFEDPSEGKYTDDLTLPGNRTSRDNFGPYVVPEDSFFMMGDNRDNSHDSRFMGPVARELIKGKAMIIYWSWDSERRGELYRNLASLPKVVGGFLWNLPARVRYGRLGDVIH
jgi:signal peptidase I